MESGTNGCVHLKTAQIFILLFEFLSKNDDRPVDDISGDLQIAVAVGNSGQVVVIVHLEKLSFVILTNPAHLPWFCK